MTQKNIQGSNEIEAVARAIHAMWSGETWETCRQSDRDESMAEAVAAIAAYKAATGFAGE